MDYELPLVDYKLDSETKSTSKNLTPFDVNNYFSSNESNSPNNQNLSEVSENIFKIVKDYTKMTQQTAKENIPTVSDRMKIKRDNKKLLLGEKKRREEESTNTNNNNTQTHSSILSTKKEKEFIVEDDKVIKLNNQPDKNTKKEIKMIRNRISAQKSRDRKRYEMEQLQEYSKTLFNENKTLKKKLEESESNYLNLKGKIKQCPTCSQIQNKK